MLPTLDTPKPKELIILASVPLMRAKADASAHYIGYGEKMLLLLNYYFLESQPLSRESSALTI
jgi:hypothetical protein